MNKSFKLTFAALMVSFALSGCKSTENVRVVNISEKQRHIVTERTELEKKVDELKSKSQLQQKPKLKNEVESAVLVSSTPAVVLTANSGNAVNVDSREKFWRMLPLAKESSLIDGSQNRRENREHFVLIEELADNSPFSATEEDKPYNHYLILDLGENDGRNRNFIRLQKEGESYLGKHIGQYKDSRLEGEKVMDSGIAQKADTLNYLYVNQAHSSYGALYTNENDANLFHLHLSTGRAGKKKNAESSDVNYAEYGVWDFVGSQPKWNDGVVGDATYKGDVIARVVHNVDGNPIAEVPKFDGTVEITLSLNNDWDKNKLNGEIHSHTLGKIELTESSLPDARYLTDLVSFNGETATANPDFSGYYYTQFAGEKLDDVVGSIEIENVSEPDNGIVKYDAVFGGTKQ